MIRRLAPCVVLMCLVAGATEPAAPVAGRNYRILNPAQPTTVQPGQIEVIEFFSIACPHCAEFEPYLQSWNKRKPANVVLVRLPAVFKAAHWKLLARTYLALVDVGADEKVTPKLLQAIHSQPVTPEIARPLGEYVARSQRDDSAAMAEAERTVVDAIGTYAHGIAGVDPARFRAAYYSFSVTARLAQYEQVYRRYGVLGVPTIAVDGRYLSSVGPDYGNSLEGLVRTLDHLVDLEQKRIGGPRTQAAVH